MLSDCRFRRGAALAAELHGHASRGAVKGWPARVSPVRRSGCGPFCPLTGAVDCTSHTDVLLACAHLLRVWLLQAASGREHAMGYALPGKSTCLGFEHTSPAPAWSPAAPEKLQPQARPRRMAQRAPRRFPAAYERGPRSAPCDSKGPQVFNGREPVRCQTAAMPHSARASQRQPALPALQRHSAAASPVS